MTNFFGYILNTINYQVERDIRQTLYKNKTFLKSRWGILEHNIVQWSTHYKKYTLLTCTLAVLAVLNAILWQSWIKVSVDRHFDGWRELLEWQDVFLSGQLTIVGVVYPLVVGLISVLFQNKSAKRIIFPIYQKYSGFMFAGLSGLMLSGFIVLSNLFRPALDEHTYLTICIITSFWLLSNFLLTAWFFVKTFRMLDETSREAIVLRFSIHETGEFDVRRRLKHLLFENIVHRGLISSPDKEVLEIQSYQYSARQYQEITKPVDSDQSIKDVKLRLINIAIWVQFRLLKIKGKKGGKLLIRPVHGRRSSDSIVVSQYSDFEINAVVKALIKLSFTYCKESKQEDVGLATVLHGFLGPANDALRDNDARQFTEALDNLVLWHTEIAKSLSFKNDNGDFDNWLLLPTSGFIGGSYLDELMGEYYRLAKAAVEKIPENSRFYTKMLYLHKHIYSNREELVKQEMKLLIQGNYYMWYALIEWRSYNSSSNDLRIANKYEDVLYDFVGAWESWLMFIEPKSIRLGETNNAYLAYVVHLEFTASTAISALRYNNFEAAGWGVDMLVNWLDNLTSESHFDAAYRWQSVLINHTYLKLYQDDSVWQVILKDNEFDYGSAFNLSFRNTHIDLRVLTASYMLLKPSGEHSDLLVTYVLALLKGSRIHPTSSATRERNSVSTAGAILGAYFRQRDYRNSGYGDWLSSILGSFGRIYEERLVSGRFYMGWSANNTRSMNKAYVEMAISMSHAQWVLPRPWEEALVSGFYGYNQLQMLVSDLNDWITIANDNHNYVLFNIEEQEDLKINFVESIKNIIDTIDATQKSDVANAQIDENLLAHYGKKISAVLSNDNNSSFPITLFGNLDKDSDIPDSYLHQVYMDNYPKAIIATAIDANRAINEEDWMADTVANNIKVNILRVLIGYNKTAVYSYNSVDNVLADVEVFSTSEACPVLFTGNQQLKSMLRRLAFDSSYSNKLNITRQDGFSDEYICHVGRCEVYSLSFSDFDYSIFTSKELFSKLEFRRVADYQNVEVSFDTDKEDESSGRLNFRYWMKVDLSENTSCIKLELAEEKNELITG